LGGSGNGVYVCSIQDENVPSGFHMTANAVVRGMGQVTVMIDVYGVGFYNGTAYGRATFVNNQGTVVVNLTGPVQPRLSLLPQQFSYRVVGATGIYRGLFDAGTLQLIRTPSPNPVFNGIRYVELGVFRIVIG
jgi:hypothetical protein